jgi:hypothetical protein
MLVRIEGIAAKKHPQTINAEGGIFRLANQTICRLEVTV